MRDRIFKVIQIILVVGILIMIPICIYESYKTWLAYKEFNNPSVVEKETYFNELPSYEEDESKWPKDTLFIEQKREEYETNDLRLIVPRIKCDEYVVNGTQMENLKTGPGLYECSQMPGEGNRNVSIAAHRSGYSHYANLFKNIHTIGEGDLLYLTDEQVVYVYKYKETVIVEPSDLSVLYLQGYSCLTLTSCHPLGENKQRIIVRSDLQRVIPYEKDMEFPKEES